MENKRKKCSLKKHSESEAISYCSQCKIYLCNKCYNYHNEVHANHNLINLDKDLNEIFIDKCKYENHKNELEFFCKNHNTLCCVSCLCKIKIEGKGQHTDCNACVVKEIENEKKNKLKENIKFLEELSKNIEKSINEIKKIFEKINENKETLKTKIQKIFTKLRN